MAKVNKTMQSLSAHQLEDFNNNGSMLNICRPFDRGYLNNWKCEIDVWSTMFDAIDFKPLDQALVMTEPPFNPITIQNDTDEVVFEYFNFKEYCRRSSSWFSCFEYLNNNLYSQVESNHSIDKNPSHLNSCTVVDSGFSFSHAVPFINSICRKDAIRRVNIGGKLLTNYLKELVSYRQWNMMDEFLLMNQVKEDLTFLSTDFMRDLKQAKQFTIAPPGSGSRDRKVSTLKDTTGTLLKKLFVLPDFLEVRKGFVKGDTEIPEPQEQVLSMEIERFCVPELLFSPSDIGIDQAGIAEATWQSLSSMGEVNMALAARRIVLTGGNTKIPQFKERFLAELRPFVPAHLPVHVILPDQPDLFAWQGAVRFVQQNKQQGTLSSHMVTKEQYQEWGHRYCSKKFDQ